jgi:hypothetical protein
VKTSTAIHRFFSVAFSTRPTFSVNDFLVAIKRGSTVPVDFVRFRNLSNSQEKQFQTISSHEKQGEEFS